MTKHNGCIILHSVDHHETFAYPIARSVDKSDLGALMAFALDFASTLALDTDELIIVGATNDIHDPGAARLLTVKAFPVKVGNFMANASDPKSRPCFYDVDGTPEA